MKHIPGRRCPLSDASGWHALVELSDTSDNAVLDEAMQEVLGRALELGLISDAVVASSEAQRDAMWQFRHSVSEANKKGGIGLTTDCAVPVSAVPAFIEAATTAVRAMAPGVPMVVVAHLGDGNAHFIPFFSFAEWNSVADKDLLAHKIRHAENNAAAALGGTFSAEHGIGQTGVGEMAQYKSAVELALMRKIKRAVDPQGLFNPGRLLPD